MSELPTATAADATGDYADVSESHILDSDSDDDSDDSETISSDFDDFSSDDHDGEPEGGSESSGPTTDNDRR